MMKTYTLTFKRDHLLFLESVLLLKQEQMEDIFRDEVPKKQGWTDETKHLAESELRNCNEILEMIKETGYRLSKV